MNICELAMLKKLGGGGGGGNANIDVTAEVGQTIIVKEVDANGKPTKWESAEYQERICWADETVILPETTVEVEDAFADLPAFTLVGGAKYSVNYNGTEYVCECIVGEENSVFMGNTMFIDLPDTGEPFAILTEGEGEEKVCGMFAIDGSTTVTVSITKVDVNPIPVEYVVNAFPYYVEARGDMISETQTEYSTSETVANLMAVVATGRDVIMRVDEETSLNGTRNTILYRLGWITQDGSGMVAFSSPAKLIIFTPTEDGGYSVSSNNLT